MNSQNTMKIFCVCDINVGNPPQLIGQSWLNIDNMLLNNLAKNNGMELSWGCQWIISRNIFPESNHSSSSIPDLIKYTTDWKNVYLFMLFFWSTKEEKLFKKSSAFEIRWFDIFLIQILCKYLHEMALYKLMF